MSSQGKRRFLIAAFLAPGLLLYLIFVIWPLVQAGQISFYHWRGTSNIVRWAGTENYQRIASDPVVPQALTNNVLMMIGGGFCILVLALIAAHAVQKSDRLSRLFESLYLFPQVVSAVVVAMIWQFMVHPRMGPLPQLQKALGLGEHQSGWLATNTVALPTVTAAFVWMVCGFYILLFSAGLRQIPAEVMEAAELDRCRGWRKFIRITWPMLWSVKKTAVVYLIITTMNTFALTYLMSKGGPDRRSEVMLTYLYEVGITDSEFGYSSALAIVNFVLVMAVSLAVLWLFRRSPMESKK